MQLAGKKIEESRKTQLALGLGPKIGQAERELVALEKDIGSLMKQLPGIDKRKDEAHQCILKLRKQQA